MMSASPRPQKRTAHTCVTCRMRKVRCDGRRNECINCERLGFVCVWGDNSAITFDPAASNALGFPIDGQPSPTSPTFSVPRRRARQACQNCHAKKARCSGSMPRCDRCRIQGLECIYRPGKRSLPLPSSSNVPARETADGQDVTMHDNDAYLDQQTSFTHSHTASPSPALALDLPDPQETLALRAFDSFFRHVHHIPMFSFLHRASLMERYHAGMLDRSLLLALVGITALLTDDLGPGLKDYGERCIDESASLCTYQLESPSILRLQALVIVVKHRILSKRFSSAFMLHAIASRFATVLRLNHENPGLCFLAQESRRRLMWSLYMIDSGISNGQTDFALWPDPERQVRIQLPCNERNFEFDLPESTEPLRPPSCSGDTTLPPLPDAVGFMALHVRMHWMRTRILERAIKVASNPLSAAELAALPSHCAELVAELQAFEARLPLSFRWSESNLRLRAYSPRLGIFVMTHVWWRQCHLDLYRLFLPGLKEALSLTSLGQLDPNFVSEGHRQCYEHARAMADMFAQLLTLGNSIPITDIDLPGCAFQCVRVLYHGLQTAGNEMGFTAAGVQELASVCLRAARQSTAGPACASIQADIEKLIKDGLPLAGNNGGANNQQQPFLDNAPILKSDQPEDGDTLTGTGRNDQMPPGTVTMAPPAAIISNTAVPASVAPSQASAVTSGSNAFQEALEGINFGPELFGSDSWAWNNDWLNTPAAGNFVGGSNC
ncbi:hypothetical protein B0H66DRAFT_110220 [Apodospora peruviana]|uniref:Zn(2)-C6 fungal-type domain-containing protein n=1 Tax=Apodospora peruviana TaxID=516989 RepID=A0AAE0II10_9PEZI|nr:hypothetical protein B0H66DRAFT_110220 [Apodospora peruviana]